MKIQKYLLIKAVQTLDRLFGFQKVRGHSFCSKMLKPTSTVLDLGANLGKFSNHIALKYGCRVFAVEASPDLFTQIDDSVLECKYNYAVARNNGFMTFYESNNIEAGNIIAPKSNSTGKTFKVKARNLTTLISEIGLKEIDLLKVDIEGAEIELFNHIIGEKLNCIKQMTVEFHDSVAIPNVSTQEVERIIEKIKSTGFDGIAMGHKNLDWFFLNKKIVNSNVPIRFYIYLRNQLTSRLNETGDDYHN